jgi:2-succinyl-6-hydroxy-2,4-cyclohexadiene-1-carboxylate synthase
LDLLPGEVDRLIGYSMGGRFALGLIALEPRRFRSATLISTDPGLEDADARRARRARDAAWAKHLLERGLPSFVEAWSNQPLFASQQRLPDADLERQRLARLGQDTGALADSLVQHGLGAMPSLWGALSEYPGELSWIVGELDAKFVAIAREVVRRRPQTQLQILPDVGHNPGLERPEDLARAIGKVTREGALAEPRSTYPC